MELLINRKIHILISFLFFSRLLVAQQIASIDIETCYRLATRNSPLYEQKALTTVAGNMTEKNLNLKWLPQLDINAQGTYQSAVTTLPIKIPNVTIEELSRDQYKGTLDLVQPIYDGGLLARQKKLQNITTQAEALEVEVNLYQLLTTINSYYFTALLMDQNIQVMKLVEQDLNNSINTVMAQVSNGIATKSNADVLKAELLKSDQQMIEYDAVKKQAIQILAILTGINMGESTVLRRPVTSGDVVTTAPLRPELKLYDIQQQGLKIQSKLFDARANPKFSLFANGGYGKPGLNQLKNEFDWFYITGVKLNIPIMGRITKQKDKAVLKIQEQVVAKQKELFLMNNRQLSASQKGEIDKYRKLTLNDSAIIVLRIRIKENAFVKLSNGIITTDEFIRELNAENEARLNQQLHEISLLKAIYTYKTIIGQ